MTKDRLSHYKFLRRCAHGDEIHPYGQRFDIDLLDLARDVALQKGLAYGIGDAVFGCAR